MTKDLKHSVSIEQFLANEMSASERLAFERDLKSDPDLAEELKLAMRIDSALEREDIIDLRQKLLRVIEANRQQPAEVPVVRMHVRKWWYAAASVLVLCAVAATLFLQSPRNLSNDAIFSEFYNASNMVDQTRGDQNLVEAVIKFQQKDFATASVLFKNILEKDHKNIAVMFYYGIANIETQQLNVATKAFEDIIAQNDNLFVEHAKWYLGLCYLKKNQNEKATDQFVEIASDPDNYHRHEARAILDKMKVK